MLYLRNINIKFKKRFFIHKIVCDKIYQVVLDLNIDLSFCNFSLSFSIIQKKFNLILLQPVRHKCYFLSVFETIKKSTCKMIHVHFLTKNYQDCDDQSNYFSQNCVHAPNYCVKPIGFSHFIQKLKFTKLQYYTFTYKCVFSIYGKSFLLSRRYQISYSSFRTYLKQFYLNRIIHLMYS